MCSLKLMDATACSFEDTWVVDSKDLGFCQSGGLKFHPPHYRSMEFLGCLKGQEWNSLAKGWNTTYIQLQCNFFVICLYVQPHFLKLTKFTM